MICDPALIVGQVIELSQIIVDIWLQRLVSFEHAEVAVAVPPGVSGGQGFFASIEEVRGTDSGYPDISHASVQRRFKADVSRAAYGIAVDAEEHRIAFDLPDLICYAEQCAGL